ncbi:MAG: hypothetical protein IH998_16740, partial [Proteobacteria bacterium]|nr:hypothetical protein [Pseudomonadota bacterium]
MTYSNGAALGAFAAAFFVGYALLPAWAAIAPTRHWHWLPYLGLVAMVMGPVGLAPGLLRVERWLLTFLLAVLAAWLLVPTWADLQPARPTYVLILTAYILLLSMLLDPLPAHVPVRLFLAALTIVAGAGAIMLAVFVSLTFGQLAGIAATAMAGCTIAAFRVGGPTLTRAVIPAFAVLVGGSLFVGSIEPDPALHGFLLVPAAPLGLWTCLRGPLARHRGVAGGTIGL